MYIKEHFGSVVKVELCVSNEYILFPQFFHKGAPFKSRKRLSRIDLVCDSSGECRWRISATYRSTQRKEKKLTADLEVFLGVYDTNVLDQFMHNDSKYLWRECEELHSDCSDANVFVRTQIP